MPTKPTLPGLVYRPTPTRHVAQRGGMFIVRWTEHGARRRRSFKTYEAACAFVRDYVQPFRASEGALPPTAVTPAKGGSWIYVFRSSGPGEPVKIGRSTDPARRLKDVATGHPHRIDLVALLPGSRGLERALHERLAQFRMEGEWFSREAERELERLIHGLIALPPTTVAEEKPCKTGGF
ncbi:MAG: GIY-YIG nuclease family protein [Acidobacteriota bacterium]|nr:GIY-YIG nuclease family protein [Acidobacteriota bacterium]